MSGWEYEIFGEDTNVDFLDMLNELDVDDEADLDEDDTSGNADEKVYEAVSDAIKVALAGGHVTEDDKLNGLAAATIVALWAEAPYSAGDIVNNYPFIRRYIDHFEDLDELFEPATTLLEQAETDEDLEVYLEALS